MAGQTFIPVIIGTDLNAYHMAAAFHEAYGVKPHLLGKMQLGFTHYSTIIEHTELIDRLDDADVFCAAVIDYARRLPRSTPLLLVGTSDHYVRLIVEHAEQLSSFYRFNYPGEELMNQLLVKDSFYPLAAEYGLPIPETYIHQVGDPVSLPISRFPVILKPSNGVQYYRHRFHGQEKVYRLYNQADVERVIATIEASGYRDSLIIQDFIPGDDTYMWDSVLYLNTEADAEFVNCGQVVLQEHESSAIGNYTAILSRFEPEVMTRLKDFLEAVGYTGIANVDLKYDSRDEEFKVLEVNIRQGRSSWYATAQGHNLAAYLVEDLVNERRGGQCAYADREVLFTVVPTYILRRYVTNPGVHADIRRMITEQKVHNPLYYCGDKSLRRRAWLAVRGLRYRRKYASATWGDQL